MSTRSPGPAASTAAWVDGYSTGHSAPGARSVGGLRSLGGRRGVGVADDEGSRHSLAVGGSVEGAVEDVFAGSVEGEGGGVAFKLFEAAEHRFGGPGPVGGDCVVRVAPRSHEGHRSAHRYVDLGLGETVVEHLDDDAAFRRCLSRRPAGRHEQSQPGGRHDDEESPADHRRPVNSRLIHAQRLEKNSASPRTSPALISAASAAEPAASLACRHSTNSAMSRFDISLIKPVRPN